MTDYPTLADVLETHRILLEKTGGAQGIRDIGLIEAALFRPQTGYYEDLIQEAAALWESLSQNHPFVDGNKRIALAMTDAFLRANGHAIRTSPDQLYAFMMERYETGTFNLIELDRWLRAHTNKI